MVKISIFVLALLWQLLHELVVPSGNRTARHAVLLYVTLSVLVTLAGKRIVS